MQEVSVRPRALFRHAVAVDAPGMELSWTFCTRKKNIAFGLFRSVQRPSNLSPPSTLPPTKPRRSATAPVTSASPATSQQPATPASQQQPPSQPSSPQPVRKHNSSSSINSLDMNNSNKRSARPRLDDPDLEEIVPIAHYESSKATIKGGFVVQEPGTYVLVFDNRFSLNTPKKLFFFVAIKTVEPASSTIKKEVEGWMLKKGNHAMQGFQRRWVEIDSRGQLSYFKSPGTPIRASVALPNAAIRLDHDHLLIDIDSGQSTFHFKVETADEFIRWIGAIEKFAASRSLIDLVGDANSTVDNLAPTDHRQSMLHSSQSNMNLSARQSISFPSQTNIMVPPDPELDSAQSQIDTNLASIKTDLYRIKDLIESIKTRSQSKDVGLALTTISETIASTITSTSTTESQLTAFHSRLRGQRDRALIAIQQAESAFVSCLNDNNRIRTKFGLELVTISSFLLNSALYANGMVRDPSLSIDRDGMGSLASTTARGDVYFDAEEGDSDDASDDDSDYDEDDDPSSHRVVEDDEVAVTPTANFDVDSPATVKPELRPPPYSSSEDLTGSNTTSARASAAAAAASSSLQLEPSAPSSSDKKPSQSAVVRRTKLPAPTCSMQNISIMSILRNNVGKDLSTVAMPIVLNEPINLLQKICEELEYCELLDTASATIDPIERLCIVAGFVVSGYSSTVYRAARKPFNPLLGETYELIREDKGFKYISEKVSHHPPIMACHAESPHYRYYQDSLLKTRFWGKSMELTNIGTVHLEFPELGEHYVWNKVTTSMRNLFSPGRYLEHHGTMRITSTVTGHYCELVFKESGYFTSANNEVAGGIYTPTGQKTVSLTGRWDHSLNKFNDSAPDNLQVVWRASPFPADQADNYGFTLFAIQLNELTHNMTGLLPNTDTRYRPDQRLYEQGNLDAAESEKQRLEQKQREFRKRMESQGVSWTPQFFELKTDSVSEGGRSWQYNGRYFDMRGKFKPVVDLFS